MKKNVIPIMTVVRCTTIEPTEVKRNKRLFVIYSIFKSSIDQIINALCHSSGGSQFLTLTI